MFISQQTGIADFEDLEGPFRSARRQHMKELAWPMADFDTWHDFRMIYCAS